MKFCSKCGAKLEVIDKFCNSCGTKVIGVPVEESNTQISMVNENNVSSQKNNGFALAGFIISLVSTICCCGCLSGLSLIFSIIGLSQINKTHEGGKGLAIAGIVLSSIGFLIIIGVYLLSYTTSFFNELGY